MLRRKSETRYQPSTVRLTAVRALDPPLVLLVVPQSCFDVLVELGVGADIPFLVDVFEITAKFGPCRVAFLEVEVHV